MLDVGLGLKTNLFAHVTIFGTLAFQHLRGETKTQGKKINMSAGAGWR